MTNTTEGVEVWRGGVNAWECDEMGHMNVRFYLSRAMEGLQGLAAALALPEAFSPAATSTLSVREHHIRFHGEARVGAPLFMTAGVVSLDEHEAVLLQTLRHSGGGDLCATFLTRAAHVTSHAGRAFAWSSQTRAAAAALMVEAPESAQPRGLPSEPRETTASRARADALDLPAIGRGVVQPGDCDVFGRMSPDAVMGRCAESAPHLIGFMSGAPGARIGRVLLEARLLYPRPARIGAAFELRSGAAELGARVQTFVHWMIDPLNGEAMAAAMVLAASFDLDARRVQALSAEGLATLEAWRIAGLRL